MLFFRKKLNKFMIFLLVLSINFLEVRIFFYIRRIPRYIFHVYEQAVIVLVLKWHFFSKKKFCCEFCVSQHARATKNIFLSKLFSVAYKVPFQLGETGEKLSFIFNLQKNINRSKTEVISKKTTLFLTPIVFVGESDILPLFYCISMICTGLQCSDLLNTILGTARILQFIR